VLGIDQQTYQQVFEQKLHSLRKLVQDLERGLPPRTSEQFILGLNLIIDAVELFLRERVENLKATFAANPQELAEQIAFHAKVALQILGALHQKYLPLLHAETQRNEYLLYPSIDRAVREFTKSFELTLVPDFVYNYAFVGKENFASHEIKLLAERSDQNTKTALTALRGRSTLKQWITFLHFPVADRDSALNLCVLAHELGHLVDKTNKIYEKLLPIELDKASFDKLVETRCKTPPFGMAPQPGDKQFTFETIFKRPGVEARCYLSCHTMLENWIREIIADVLAIHAIGPASYFAFNDFFAYMGAENVTSNSHPAPAFRLQLMLAELKEVLGYSSSSGAIGSVLAEAMPNVAAGASAATYRDEADVVQKTIEKNLDRKDADNLLAKIRPFVSAYSFNAATYRQEVPDVLKKLRSGVAPIETLDSGGMVRPASVVAILNAGWELYKTNIDGFYDEFRAEVPKMERLANLNHLLFKAIEASEVVRRWK
jgi:hypothetical protein